MNESGSNPNDSWYETKWEKRLICMRLQIAKKLVRKGEEHG
jgi:hypothetical protein